MGDGFKKLPTAFFRQVRGGEPVREWLKGLLHGFIKKTPKTPGGDLDLARRRKQELER